MPSIVAGTQIVTPALTLIGVTTQGETPSTTELTEGTTMLNQMLRNWSSDGLTNGEILEVSGTLTSGSITAFIGTGGSIWSAYPASQDPPVRVVSGYQLLSTRKIPLKVETQEWFKTMQFPEASAAGPEYVGYIPSNAALSAGVVLFYPAPSGNVTVGINVLMPFRLFSSSSDAQWMQNYAVQPAIYNLAVNIAPAFGVNVPPSVAKEAQESLSRLRNYNASLWNMDPNPPGGQTLTPPAPPTP